MLSAAARALRKDKVIEALELYEPGLMADLLALAGMGAKPAPTDVDSALAVLHRNDNGEGAADRKAYKDVLKRTLMRLQDMAERKPGDSDAAERVHSVFRGLASEAIQLGEMSFTVSAVERNGKIAQLSAKLAEAGIGSTPDLTPVPEALAASRERARLREEKKSASNFQAAAPERIGAAEMARTIGVSLETLKRLRKQGGGPPFTKPTRRVSYDREAGLAWAKISKRLTEKEGG